MAIHRYAQFHWPIGYVCEGLGCRGNQVAKQLALS